MAEASPILEIRALTKRYEIVRTGGRGRAWFASDAATWITRSLLRAVGRKPPSADAPDARYEQVWALRDVSFDVARGEVLGLVGHNGAGKSTLLKVLSRVTEPTAGHAILRGRLNSLLEVGVGFHPELTGRENIYLKGAIHGLTRAAIRREFDAIVAFAEVERFLDTPLKRYSSGMRSRLGFAIGAYLEHEILVVDEVLAVGDARFRAQAMARIREAARDHGTTTIFVSHDLGQIRELCERSVLLEEGRLIADGPTNEVLERYLQPNVTRDLPSVWEAPPGELRHIRRVALHTPDGAPTSSVRVGDPLSMTLHATGMGAFPDLDARVAVDSVSGQRVFRFRSSMTGVDVTADGAPELAITADIASLPLVPGHYWLNVTLSRARTRLETRERVLRFEVLSADPYGAGAGWLPPDGPVWVPGAWRAEAAAPTPESPSPGEAA
ncbi:MAG: ABC transporter ATP-binding protein [Myxococcales bacterium]|nr:ABC transporter ATP-binding protein [Myxococcales bacterium]MCB9733572.1 ABC transporter ATP-binding protein [Deltaproteobacteria bacterium]